MLEMTVAIQSARNRGLRSGLQAEARLRESTTGRSSLFKLIFLADLATSNVTPDQTDNVTSPARDSDHAPNRLPSRCSLTSESHDCAGDLCHQFFIVSDNIADISTNLPTHIDRLCNSPDPVLPNWPEEVDL